MSLFTGCRDRTFIFLKYALVVFLALLNLTAAAQDTVQVTRFAGVINPAASEYFAMAIDKAHQEQAVVLVIELNTPGGLVTSMRQIAQSILTAPLPVAVYVAPSGARAASAGTFITLAGHVAAMAPGTNIGAASVVSMGMAGDSMKTTMMRKATNDAVAFIRSIAEERGRNAEWAASAVTDAAAITASEALELNVIDFVAPDLDSLLKAMNGRRVVVNGQAIELNTGIAVIKQVEMPLRFRILEVISNPTVAYLLLIIGLYGLFFEGYNPGAILPGIVGGISLILALYAFNTLPVNYAGVLLLLLGLIMFILEIKVPSFGALTIGGIASFAFGSLMLFDSKLPFFSISWQVIAAVTAGTALFFIFAIGMGLRAQRRKPTTGQEEMVGASATALEDFDGGDGKVLYNGEIWMANSTDIIAKGTAVKVVHIQGLRLTVALRAD